MSQKNKILVKAVAKYIEAQSVPKNGFYVFSYTITLINVGIIPAQLISRRWVITDSNDKIQQVEGEGVIGKQPLLKVDQSFSYSSGAVIETPVGIMQGEYSMLSDEGDTFLAEIPQFTLSIPRTLH